MTHRGQSESVFRGQPRGGFDFSHVLSMGFSDHRGVKDGFGDFFALKYCTAFQIPVAVFVRPFSTYLMGRCIDGVSFFGSANARLRVCMWRGVTRKAYQTNYTSADTLA